LPQECVAECEADQLRKAVSGSSHGGFSADMTVSNGGDDRRQRGQDLVATRPRVVNEYLDGRIELVVERIVAGLDDPRWKRAVLLVVYQGYVGRQSVQELPEA